MAGNDKLLIYGKHPVLDALRDGTDFEKIYLQTGTRGELEKTVRQLTRDRKIPIQYVPKIKLDKLTRQNHQGIIGTRALIKYYTLEDVLPGIFENGDNPLLIILDGVTDVRNMGAIARSAEAFGAQALVIAQQGGGQINSDSIKTSAGALQRLAVCREKSLVKAVGWLQVNGVQVYATDLNGSQPISKVDFTGPTALVVGSEGAGVSPAILKQADDRIIIPQIGESESLNVSVATGVLLYEVSQQRMHITG